MRSRNSSGTPLIANEQAKECSDERLAWVALALIPGLGARRIAALLQAFGSARQVLDAPLRGLREVAGIPASVARTIAAVRPDAAIAMLARASAAGQQALVPSDVGYPSLLRSIPDPPTLLFIGGDINLISMLGVAIVGSRIHTSYGASVAAEIARVAARSGIAVISGMARGLDAVAHRAALDAGGVSIGVLGTGVDLVYPAQNRALFDRMRSPHGVLISEYPPGSLAQPGAFPRRNRLISGLARAVVVVEAAASSGTLITVACALEQGRDVVAVPGPVTSATSKGTNQLVRDGATPLLSPDDLPRILGVAPCPPPPTHRLPCPPISRPPRHRCSTW